MESTINNLRNQLKEEEIKNKNLFNENNKLKQEIIQLQNKVIDSQIDFKNLNNLSNEQIYQNNSIIKLIKDKEDIINDLNEKIKRFPFILEKNEKLMAVIFSSVNQKINYSIVCKNTDSIHKLEEELYKEYPDLFEKQHYIYLCKGKVINKYQTFESYHIKNGDTIILNSNEESGLFN